METNKNYHKIKDIAAMLNAYKDELDKLLTSSPGGNMSLLMRMLTFPTNDTITFDTPMMHEFQNMSEEDVVRAERKERKRELSKRRSRIDMSDEQRSAHFKRKQKEYDVEVDEKLLELDEWYDDIETFEARIPNQLDFDGKINEIHNALNKLCTRINPSLLFKNGADDTALCGRILIKMEKDWDNKDEKEAVCLMSALQWLISQKAVDCVEIPKIINEINEGEDENGKEVTSFNEALRILCRDYLHLDKGERNTKVGEKDWNKSRLIVALMHVLAYRKVLPTNDEKAFAKLVAPIINKSAENLRKSINKLQLTIKPYGRNLKDLSESYIRSNHSNDERAMTPRIFKEQCDGMFDLIDGFISTIESLAPLRGNSAQNREHSERTTSAKIKDSAQ